MPGELRVIRGLLPMISSKFFRLWPVELDRNWHQHRAHFGIVLELRVQQPEDEDDYCAGECHSDRGGDRSCHSAQTVTDDYRDIGRNYPRDGLTNLANRQEVIFVEPLLTQDQMVAQIGNGAAAETGRTYIKENPEQLREAYLRSLNRRIFNGVQIFSSQSWTVGTVS